MPTSLSCPPTVCQVNNCPIVDEVYDFAMPAFGYQWGYGCPACFKAQRGRLGTGYGQHFVKQSDNRFVKVAG